ncbi:MAG TPA: DNA repair protein RecO [Anaerolineales bacterium]|nr:DNA repair protein RecO [Anaerolineales bacterium]
MSGRERIFRTEAVILRRHDLGEADRLVVAYSPDRGKLRLVAKGARRLHSRKAGHLEPFSRTSLLIARGRELDIISQAEALETFPTLLEDLQRLGQASYVVELIDRFTLEEGGSRPAYTLLRETLGRLAQGREAAPVLRYFELRLLELMGYRPEFFRCVQCGAEVRPEPQSFAPALGGVLCPRGHRGQPGARPLSLEALKVLRHYQRSGFEAAAAPQVRPDVRGEVEGHLEAYLNLLLERRLNSPRFLRQIQAEQEAVEPAVAPEAPA